MSAMSRFTVLGLLACQSASMMLKDQGSHLGVSSEAQSMPNYKKECWQKRPVSLSQVENVPGAGIAKFEPFKTVEKDGFLEAACVKDYMYSHGDKFGDNRHSYKLGERANVSIVHYDAHVAKTDRKPMTHTVCFEFCRTVPNMGFFGITNGRDCYCAPYYKPMESDSSICDATCEGDATLFCGGKAKSTVFSMHMCADTAQDLKDAAGDANKLKTSLSAEVKAVQGLSKDMQDTASKLQGSFGKVGDSASTNLMQSAKVFAGDLQKAAADAEKVATKLGDLGADAKKITKFTDPAEVAKADRIVEGVEKTTKQGKDSSEKLVELRELAEGPKASKGASKQYYPVMYFVDKAHEKTPQTCGGETLEKPIVGADEDGCATACDDHTDCVGYSYYGGEKKLCFLLKNFESAFYYTGCGAFLQTTDAAAPFAAKCAAKFSKFEGTTLKPDPSGKCKQCFKKVTEANRCFK